MLLPNMTLVEIYQEVANDIESIQAFAKSQENIVRTKMLRDKQKYLKLNHTAKSKNNWTITCRHIDLKVQASYYLQHSLQNSIIAYLPIFGDNDFYLVKYRPHFFTRYRTRMSLQIDSTEKLIYHFFKSNFDITIGKSSYESDGTRHVRIIFNEGVGMGLINEQKKIVSLQTFLSPDNLTESQNEMVDFLKNNEDEQKFFVDPHPLREFEKW